MRAHEAGALHAEGYGGPPHWLPWPADVMELLPQLWPQTVRRDGSGRLEVGGVDVVTPGARVRHRGIRRRRGGLPARARAFRDEFAAPFEPVCGGVNVYYAGKAFLCTAVAGWVAEEGLSLDVSSGGELAVAQRAGFPAERIGMHGNNKSLPEIQQALEYGVGRIIVDSFEEIERIAAVATELGVTAPVMIRVTVGVEAHTHEFIATAHEDQKFGFSPWPAGRRPRRCAGAGARRRAGPARPALPHRQPDLRHLRLRGLRAPADRAARPRRDQHGVHMPEMDLGGGYGIAYTSEHTPLTPAELGEQLADLVRREFKAIGDGDRARSPDLDRAGAGPSSGQPFTLYEVGTVKDVDLGHGAKRTYVSVDGGMSDNVRTALYDADYSCTLASRRSGSVPRLSRVVGKHCESGDIIVMDEYLPDDIASGDLIAVPGTGAYCRSLSSQYNHTPRPPVLAVRDGQARVIVRRETIDDLLALDVP